MGDRRWLLGVFALNIRGRQVDPTVLLIGTYGTMETWQSSSAANGPTESPERT